MLGSILQCWAESILTACIQTSHACSTTCEAWLHFLHVVQGVPHPFSPTDIMTFGASTRTYHLQLPGNSRKRHAEDMLPPSDDKVARSVAATAGPKGISHAAGKGRFADLVHYEVHPAQHPAQPTPQKTAEKQVPASRNQPQFQKFVAQHLKRPPVSPAGSLYDQLPPERNDSL